VTGFVVRLGRARRILEPMFAPKIAVFGLEKISAAVGSAPSRPAANSLNIEPSAERQLTSAARYIRLHNQLLSQLYGLHAMRRQYPLSASHKSAGYTPHWPLLGIE
jgi:hypothetical protein